MHDTTFDIGSTRQTIKKIDPNEIISYCDALNSTISIYIGFILRAPADDTGFDMISISAKLNFSSPIVLLSETVLPVGYPVQSSDFPVGFTLTFNIDKRAIHFIESNRTGDVGMQLNLTILCLAKNKIVLDSGRRVFAADYSQRIHHNINFEIPRSKWVEKILPGLGFKNLRLVEVPMSHENLKEAYDDIVAEFDQAEHYFNLHDYTKCVSHCRHTLDALHRNLRSIKNESKSETGFKWLETTSAETLQWLTALDKSTYGLTSKTHHSGPAEKKEFSRYEAEAIYLVILGLLNYVGHLKP